LKGKKVIELGSGCGFTSIYLAKKLEAEKCLITDMGSVVSVINENILLNECDPT
jgi:tRNA1(Val) A37 N6-methylase TrmN6